MKNRYLKEVALSVSNFYCGEGDRFLSESACLLYFLEALTHKKIQCPAEKIVFVTRSKEYDGPELRKVQWHESDRILIIENAIDLDGYNSTQKVSDRHELVLNYLLECFRNVPEEFGVDIDLLEDCIGIIRSEKYVYKKAVGRKKLSPSKTRSAQLNVYFDCKSIRLNVSVVDVGGNKFLKLIGEYPTSHLVLEQLGKIEFVDDHELRYIPKKFFDSVLVRL